MTRFHQVICFIAISRALELFALSTIMVTKFIVGICLIGQVATLASSPTVTSPTMESIQTHQIYFQCGRR